MVYAIYKDDGASGCCGQQASITDKKTKLFVFESWKDFEDARTRLLALSGRRHPRFEDVFSDDETDCAYEVFHYERKDD